MRKIRVDTMGWISRGMVARWFLYGKLDATDIILVIVNETISGWAASDYHGTNHGLAARFCIPQATAEGRIQRRKLSA